MSEPLTIHDVLVLSSVIDMAASGAPITWQDDDGDIRTGVARSIGDENGNFLHGEDVRTGFLRITTSSGFDTFMPVPHAAKLAREGLIMRTDV